MHIIEKTLKEIADFVGGEIYGDENEKVFAPSDISKAKKGNISFLISEKYEKYLYESQASCLVTEKGFLNRKKDEVKNLKIKNFIEVENPSLAMIRILSLWEYKIHFPKEAKSLSYISPTAKIGKDVLVFPFCYIGKDVDIGEFSIIMPGTFVGDGSKIGRRVTIFPNVSIYPFCEIGDNSIIHSGAVIGSDGFGYISHFGEIIKIPQVGTVKIGKAVEIGANTCIDRATMTETIVEDDVKIDNLVQVAHNVKIGKGTRIASLTGIAGSSEIGEYCIFGGQVGVVDHVKIGDFAIIAARSAIISDTEGGKILMGEPAMERGKFLRIHSLYLKLPDLYERIKKLEKEVQELKAQKEK